VHELVSVVVPTVDRVALLERCLEGFEQDLGAPFEVLVVHDGDPGIVALLERWIDAGRNIGAMISTTLTLLDAYGHVRTRHPDLPQAPRLAIVDVDGREFRVPHGQIAKANVEPVFD